MHLFPYGHPERSIRAICDHSHRRATLACLPTLLCLAVTTCAAETGPEQPIEMSPLQEAFVAAQKKCVMPPEKRPPKQRHFVRLKTLSFDPTRDLQKQIEEFENENRRGYDAGPFQVLDATGKRGDQSGWEIWYKDVFTIEQEWAQGLKIPYFCQVLQLRDDEGNPVVADRLSESDWLALSRKTTRAILKPVAEAPEDTMQNVPIYVVRYIGNFEGNAKYVKLYLGAPGTTNFVVLDVSVYDHY